MSLNIHRNCHDIVCNAHTSHPRGEAGTGCSCVSRQHRANKEFADLQSEIARYKIALADAIRRPMGVVPDSARGLVSQEEVDAAEVRRSEGGGE